MTPRTTVTNGTGPHEPEEVFPKEVLPTRTLQAGEMTQILHQARNASPVVNFQAERSDTDFEVLPFETTMMMDRDSLARPDRTLRPDEFPPPGTEQEDAPAHASPDINLRVEKTPPEFSHLYA